MPWSRYRRGMISPSLKAVAVRAGVSVPTVSLILSGKGQRYSVATQKRVTRTAARLGYRPNIAGRCLQQKKSLLLGVMLYGVNTSLFADFLRGIVDGVRETDYSPIVFSYNDDVEEADCLRRCLDRKVDGLVVNLSVKPNGDTAVREYERLAGQGLSLVEVFGHFINGASSVNIDYRDAAQKATEHLLERGHREIAMVTHEHFAMARTGKTGRFHDAWERYLGYEAAMGEAGLHPVVVTHPLQSELDASQEFLRGGEAAFGSLLALKTFPTAVVCYDDMQAMGLMRACQHAGVRVPAELSLVGFGDSAGARIVSPMLTSQRLPSWEVGRMAATLALKKASGGGAERSEISTELVERGSVVACGGKVAKAMLVDGFVRADEASLVARVSGDAG